MDFLTSEHAEPDMAAPWLMARDPAPAKERNNFE
jgi:hypothetical protein